MGQQPRTETDPQEPDFVVDGGAAQEAMPADDTTEDGDEDEDEDEEGGEEEDGEDAVPES